jgi:hypothetical protein
VGVIGIEGCIWRAFGGGIAQRVPLLCLARSLRLVGLSPAVAIAVRKGFT